MGAVTIRSKWHMDRLLRRTKLLVSCSRTVRLLRLTKLLFSWHMGRLLHRTKPLDFWRMDRLPRRTKPLGSWHMDRLLRRTKLRLSWRNLIRINNISGLLMRDYAVGARCFLVHRFFLPSGLAVLPAWW